MLRVFGNFRGKASTTANTIEPMLIKERCSGRNYLEKMNTKTVTKRDQILTDLTIVRNEIVNTACQYPLPIQDNIFLGIWSIKDILAHLIGWDFTNLEAARAVQAGSLPNFYTYIDKDWSSYNALLVIQYKRDNFDLLLSSVIDSHRQLVDYLNSLPIEDFFKDWGVRYKGIKVTISRLLEAEIKDEKVHLEQVRTYLKTPVQ
jgi:hypothetical protein